MPIKHNNENNISIPRSKISTPETTQGDNSSPKSSSPVATPILPNNSIGVQQQSSSNDSVKLFKSGSQSISNSAGNDDHLNIIHDHGKEDDDHEEDDERIDYSNAFLKETQNSEKILSRLNEGFEQTLDFSKVHIGFANNAKSYDAQFKKMDTKTQNQFLFDILPSFEMHHSFQHTSPDSLDNPDQRDFPPNYFNNKDQNGTVSTSCQDSLLTPGTVSTAPSVSTRFGDDISTASPVAPTTSSEIEQNIIDKSHTLPNADLSAVKVEIHITKDLPVPHQKPELESILKEYTSGDVVHGYVILENVSDKPVKFQMFNVTLEAYVSIVEVGKKRQVLKRFLTMIDMNTSWSYGCISPSANISYEAFEIDYDGCIIGFRNDRILEPHIKYKKFFTFKFPYNLLDNVCRHQQEVHTLLPPTFGIDKVKKLGKYSDIGFNTALNYGHLGYRGSPILTNDMSQQHLSISYGINARLIGFPNEKTPKLSILKDYEYCLRFIPFGFAVPLFSSKKNYDAICESIEHGLEAAERVLKLNIEGGNEYDVRQLDLENKNRQLSVASSIHSSTGQDYNSFPLRNKKYGNSDFSKVRTQLTYISNGNISGRSNFMNRLKANKPTSVTRSGLVTISSKIPKDGLPYKSPTLLRKTNEISNLSEVGYKNYDSMASQLSMNEKKKLTSLKLKFEFTPSDNSLDLSPPEIKSIKPSLTVFNVYSTSHIPIKLSPGLLKPQGFDKMKSKFQGFHNTFIDLKSKLESKGIDVERYLESSMLQDINAMKELQVEKFKLPTIFDHSITVNSQWEADSENSGCKERIVELSLSYKDKISETLIPNFQSCLLSRLYCINVDVTFKNGQTCELFVPVRIRKFDDL